MVGSECSPSAHPIAAIDVERLGDHVVGIGRSEKDGGAGMVLGQTHAAEGHGLAEYYHQLDKMQREMDWMTKYTLGQQRVVP